MVRERLFPGLAASVLAKNLASVMHVEGFGCLLPQEKKLKCTIRGIRREAGCADSGAIGNLRFSVYLVKILKKESLIVVSSSFFPLFLQQFSKLSGKDNEGFARVLRGF